MTRSTGPCRLVWLCATENPADICYRHYHTCHMSAGHSGDCLSSTGPTHLSRRRVGDMLTSVPDAYAAMELLGWGRR